MSRGESPFDRELGYSEATAIGLGTTIGAGIALTAFGALWYVFYVRRELDKRIQRSLSH